MVDAIFSLGQQAARLAWRLVQENTAIGLFLLLGTLLAPSDTSAQNAADDPAPGEQQLATFDAVWAHVRDDYFDYARVESDWVELRETLRPQAAQASRSELRTLLNGMLERIGESHFLVLPPTGLPARERDRSVRDDEVSPLASQPTGLGVHLIDNALIIDRVGSANAALIQPGWQLVAINGESLQDPLDELTRAESPAVRERAALILEASANGQIGYPDPGEELTLELLDAEGKVHTINPRRQAEPAELIKIGNLPRLAFSFRSSVMGDPERCVGTMAFTTWVPQLMDRFNEARDALFACQGLIIDLRGNLGGVLTTMVPLTGHLVDEPVLLGQLMREDGRIDFRAFPRRVANDGRRLTPYNGPVAILIDSLSASTSEMFASGLQALDRARVFGTPSPGMALPAQMRPLPNGDRLMYAFADYIDGQGRRIEGVGVTPDEIIEIRRADLLSGLDPVREAALSWLNAEHEEETQR